ncbi:zinc finger protein 62-like [Lutzomyia longipalpis]|uniref:zinc finger protein 62-like n=1 Tax=Lutzomyia longipalpis TaxID=7200 RepID=UPI002483E680|nr:zinc finger protein 62-like [Lutzomyia longipalpis]
MGSLENPLVYCDTVKNLIEQIRRIHDELIDHENTIPKCETCRLNYTEFYFLKSQLYPFVQDDATPKYEEEFNPLEHTEDNTDEELHSLDIIVKEETKIQSKDETIYLKVDKISDVSPKKKKTKRGRVVCHICSKSFYKKERLALHLTQHLTEPKEKVSCQYCKKGFFNEERLKAHLARHTGDKPFQCKVCNKAFKSWDYYISHCENHKKESDVGNQEPQQPKDGIQTELFAQDSTKNSQIKKYSKRKSAQEESHEEIEENCRDEEEAVKPFECSYCGHKFSKRQRILFHIKHHIRKRRSIKKENNELECKICHTTFDTIRGLRKHLSFHEKDPYFKCLHSSHQINTETSHVCNTCKRKFVDIATLQRHQELRDSYQLNCSICKDAMCTLTDLTNHEKLSHRLKNTFQCTHCPEKFTNFKLICKHYKTKHPNAVGPTKPFLCEFCGLSLGDSRDLKTHKTVHYNEKPHKCDVCNKGFRLPRLLKQHRRVHIPKSQRTDLYHCDKCDKGNFQSKVALWKHNRLHTGEVTEKFCKVCNKRFINPNLLESHMLTHVNEGPRPHKCDVCGKSFKVLKEFNRHKKRQHGIHNGENSELFCTVCNMRFIHLSSLENHMLKHKNEGPRLHKCDLCGIAFRILKELNKHRKRIHGILTEEMLRLEAKKKKELLKLSKLRINT